MDADFATPEAVSGLFDLVRDGNRLLDNGEDASAIAGAVESIVAVLGLDEASDPSESEIDLDDLATEFGVSGEVGSVIDQLIEIRRVARSEGRYPDADAVRDRLDSVGVTLEDGPDGTRWLRK
jgi:cysteinyl-tRNA synthetase